MTIEELRRASLDGELEYHVTGEETAPLYLLPDPGWYPCEIDSVNEEGSVEMTLCPCSLDEEDEVRMRVLARNIPIAFRRKPAQDDELFMSKVEILAACREAADEDTPTLAELIDLEPTR